MKPMIALGLAAAALLAGCATSRTPANEVSAVLRDANGRIVAYSIVRELGGIAVQVRATGLAPGTYAAHLHAVGRCEPPAFDSAGPHWNPTSRQHGSENPLGAHLGDLPNLTVDAEGNGTVEFTIPAASVRRGTNVLMDADGAAVVVHANPDDYRTDPSGNSGARIACGVLGV